MAILNSPMTADELVRLVAEGLLQSVTVSNVDGQLSVSIEYVPPLEVVQMPVALGDMADGNAPKVPQ